MITVTITKTDANTGQTTKLFSLEIVNDGTGSQAIGNYDVALFDEGGEGIAKGRVLQHARNTPLALIQLVTKALRKVGG